MMSLLLFPLLPVAAVILFMFFWMYGALYIFSVSELEEQVTDLLIKHGRAFA